jgi:hypothetical protein
VEVTEIISGTIEMVGRDMLSAYIAGQKYAIASLADALDGIVGADCDDPVNQTLIQLCSRLRESIHEITDPSYDLDGLLGNLSEDDEDEDGDAA